MGSHNSLHLIGVILFALLVASPAVITSVAAKAPPEPVCGVCTSSLEEAAHRHGVTVDSGQSTMNIRLSENGSAVFVAVVELRKGADELNNDSLRDAIVRDVSYTLVEDRLDLQTAVVDGDLRVQYASHEVAHKTFGILQFDAFQIRGAPPFASGGEGSPYPGADRLVLQAPPGYQLHGSHGDFHNETSVRWKADSHEQYSGHIEEGVTISFVPDSANFPRVRVAIANVVDWISSFTA